MKLRIKLINFYLLHKQRLTIDPQPADKHLMFCII